MRALLALCCAVALGGCAIVINPNDGDVRYSMIPVARPSKATSSSAVTRA